MRPIERLSASKDIVVYDGDCGICNFFISWVKSRVAPSESIQLIPSQSMIAESFLIDRFLERDARESLIVVLTSGSVLRRTNAFLYCALSRTRRRTEFLSRHSFPIFDHIYGAVAKRRRIISALLGLGTCRLPNF